ncbi:septum formation inhibitor Maf [Pseudomonas sp. gcc21]|uniref:Maf family protein n=1 Tax=Pseudomonas sp. gcc21 TaxID=2726989 RepID=UPI001452229E|nr:Maf family protein [Pseudomonas sp. gcc21]QJD60341.1 septum formation inhibitor Maf [Pseudomonas sp. gcc21]
MTSDHGGSLYLASASPRRRELLLQIGVPTRVMPSEIDERVLPGELPRAYVERVTCDKVRAGVVKAPGGAVVLAADTAVVLGDNILGKPADRAHGLAMLDALSGQAHSVITSVAVCRGEDLRLVSVETRVWFRQLSEAEKSAYWDTGEPADKAGGYAIQGMGAIFIERIEGSYSAVVGLPLMETAALLSEFGVSCWQAP